MKELPYARQKKIVEQLKALDRDECLRIDELARDFNVSYMTIYRDIIELEKNGEATRVYGGIMSARGREETLQDTEAATGEAVPPLPGPLPPYADSTIEERFNRQLAEKQVIAREAARFIRDGDVIAIDPSTTTLQLCSYILDRSVTVVTTSMSVVLQLASSKTVNIILCGGMVRKSALSVIGPLLPGTLDQIHINRCFMSSHAFSYRHGLTDMTMEESEAKRQLIRRSAEVNVLVDHTKLNRYAPFVVCGASEIRRIITDAGSMEDAASKKLLEEYRQGGGEVIIA